MKCQKCNKPAVVHLTEVVKQSDGSKRPVEIHLCVSHAVEAGLIAAESELVLEPKTDSAENAGSQAPTAIVPAAPAPMGLTVVRSEAASADACPICGNSWHQFRQAGLMGCPHDYAMFEGKILPLLKRAQEGATQHAGKIPARMRQSEPAREVASLRLRRELQKALDAENYEQAAQLRDQLKQMGSN